MTGRTEEHRFKMKPTYLAHYMLTWFPNHNNLTNVLITKTTNLWVIVSRVWVRVTTLFFSFSKTDAVVGMGVARGPASAQLKCQQ